MQDESFLAMKRVVKLGTLQIPPRYLVAFFVIPISNTSGFREFFWQKLIPMQKINEIEQNKKRVTNGIKFIKYLESRCRVSQRSQMF